MISFIVPTIGRPSLAQTLASIETRPGDEILVVCDEQAASLVGSFVANKYGARFVHCPKGGDWGHAERNFAMPLARGQYIAHVDDDDTYVPGMRVLMEDAIQKTPCRPVLFRMRSPNGVTLWQEPRIYCGNVGTGQYLHPNRPTMLGTWGSFVGGDCHFLETSKWKAEDYVWRHEVIYLVGHNWG
jgi:glycosyltransferase involved in cell wall biosynthesis